MMEEPSVLDYIKAKLTPWRGPAPKIPPSEPLPEAQGGGATEVDTGAPGLAVKPGPEVLPAAEVQPRVIQDFSLPVVVTWPWRSLSALLLALLAQRALGPPDENVSTGAALYGLAAILLAWSFWRQEWVPVLRPSQESAPDPFTIRWTHLIAALPFAIFTYLSFAENRVTGLGLVIWLLAMANVVWAFWHSTPAERSWQDRVMIILTRPFVEVKISIDTVAVLIGVGLVLFFRLYRLGDVPPEMTSDHAEKLLDVMDVLRGDMRVFFTRNAGREPFQMYLDAGIALFLGTGITFTTLQLGTILVGLMTVPLIYLIGVEVGNRQVGLWAALLAGIAYWPNVISRVGLRFPFYPFFTALTLYFLLRGIRTENRNSFVLAGLSLGLSAYGYTADRILPLMVVIGFGLYLIHRQSVGKRQIVGWWLTIVVIIAFVAFIPLLRFIVDEPAMFAYRSLTRVGEMERTFDNSVGEVFLQNLWDALTMFSRSGGNVWLASIPFYPALGIVSGALAHIGASLVLFRYLRHRHWLDAFLLLSVPILLLPSVLALAFPIENPNLYRTGGALVLVFLFAGLAIDGLFSTLKSNLGSRWGTILAWGLGLFLLAWSSSQNFDWVFNLYHRQYQLSSWNTSQIGGVIRAYADSVGDADTAWVVPNPHWVDTRLVGMNAGFPDKDYARWPEDLAETVPDPRPKLFIVRVTDESTVDLLIQLYPEGNLQRYTSRVNADRDFYMFYVPAEVVQR